MIQELKFDLGVPQAGSQLAIVQRKQACEPAGTEFQDTHQQLLQAGCISGLSGSPSPARLFHSRNRLAISLYIGSERGRTRTSSGFVPSCRYQIEQQQSKMISHARPRCLVSCVTGTGDARASSLIPPPSSQPSRR